MAPSYIYVAVWTLSDGHVLHTLTDEPSYQRWTQDPEVYAQKRLSRWNSPNRQLKRLSKAIGFTIERYERSPKSDSYLLGSVGSVRR